MRWSYDLASMIVWFFLMHFLLFFEGGGGYRSSVFLIKLLLNMKKTRRQNFVQYFHKCMACLNNLESSPVASISIADMRHTLLLTALFQAVLCIIDNIFGKVQVILLLSFHFLHFICLYILFFTVCFFE